MWPNCDSCICWGDDGHSAGIVVFLSTIPAGQNMFLMYFTGWSMLIKIGDAVLENCCPCRVVSCSKFVGTSDPVVLFVFCDKVTYC